MPKSKSAYSVAGKKGKLDTHIIVVWVDNCLLYTSDAADE